MDMDFFLAATLITFTAIGMVVFLFHGFDEIDKRREKEAKH